MDNVAQEKFAGAPVLKEQSDNVNEMEICNADQNLPEKCESDVKDCEQSDKCSSEATENKDIDQNKSHEDTQTSKPVVFKKPLLLVGPRRGKPTGKVKNLQPTETVQETCIPKAEDTPIEDSEPKDCLPFQDISTKQKPFSDETKILSLNPSQKLKERSIPLPYKEPSWSGIPDVLYSFEVLKDGKIIENIDLVDKSFYVIGRLSTCDIQMAHPTISRYHAVIQYRKEGNEQNSVGFYVYDLGSTHGTFLNKYRIRANIHVRIQVGHMLKFGNSTRMFILQGPESDQEEESELTVTELKEKRRLEEEERKKQEHLRELEEQKRREREEEEGIDWGMGEDADEETDLSENPYAATLNEELYLDDPKKTLHGWFEREGYELEYNVEQKAIGQFLCTVELPIGNGVIAEALVKGKKKEAVVQCALEACRILDRVGMLRQATHESRKRKAKNWEEDDFYDSDEDTFLDRTGAVEKKRQQRMQAAGKLKQEADTYESLVKKYNDVHDQIKQIEKQYREAVKKLTSCNSNASENDDDALDAYMTQLSYGLVDKKDVSNLKNQLQALQSEEERLRKLVNIAKPASLPELVPRDQLKPQTSNKAALVAAVKRKVKADQMSKLPSGTKPSLLDTGQVEEEEEEEEEEEAEADRDEEVVFEEGDSKKLQKDQKDSNTNGNNKRDKKEINKDSVSAGTNETQKTQVTASVDGSKGGKENIVSSSVSLKKIIGPSLPPGVDLTELKVPSEFDSSELNDETTKKKKKKARSRPKREKDSTVQSSMKSYDYDESDPDYSVWVPPENQSGDGRTKLNEKYGY